MTPRYRVDEGLKKYATAIQKKYIDAVNECGSLRAAARLTGVCASTVHKSLEALERVAALRGYAPQHDMTHSVPQPFMVKGVSTLYDGDGKQRAQWVKSKVNEDKLQEHIKAIVEDMVQEAKGLSKPVSPPKVTNADLLTVYPIGDPHFGMYAWAAEAGEDFDTEIAERLTLGAVDRLVASAPASETAILAPLGDVMHADNTTNRTPQSGNQLDVDTRHQRVLRIANKALRRAVYRCLEKHAKVIVRVLQGNHDPISAFSIALALQSHFENNERVMVDLSPSYFWYYRFGKVLVGLTHGDRASGKDLLGVMATDKAEDWGKTKFRYWYHGHLHTNGVKELPGVVIEWFRTLAPADAWAAAEGYRAGRDMCAIVHHKDFGEIERHRCDVAMLEAA